MDSKLLICIRVFRKKFKEEDYFGSDHIFALIREGRFLVEGPAGSFEAGPHEGVVFLKNTRYHRKVLSPVTMYLFRYESEDPLFTKTHIRFQDTARIRSTLDALDRLESEITQDAFAQRAHLFADLYLQQLRESHALLHRGKDEAMERALAAIHQGLSHKLSLPAIAARSSLSYPQFYRRFQAFTGMTPSQYVAAARLQKAKSLLTDGSLPIKTVAFACGFENEYYFSNFFKKHTGLSPTHYRNASV